MTFFSMKTRKSFQTIDEIIVRKLHEKLIHNLKLHNVIVESVNFTFGTKAQKICYKKDNNSEYQLLDLPLGKENMSIQKS